MVGALVSSDIAKYPHAQVSKMYFLITVRYSHFTSRSKHNNGRRLGDIQMRAAVEFDVDKEFRRASNSLCASLVTVQTVLVLNKVNEVGNDICSLTSNKYNTYHLPASCTL